MTRTYTFGQLYKLFGYHKKFDRSDVFGSLIGALFGLDVFYLTKYNGYDKINVCTAAQMHPELKDALKEVSCYLYNPKRNNERNIWIDNMLQSLHGLKHHRIPLYRFKANWRKYKAIRDIQKDAIATQYVFGYLEYVVETHHKEELWKLYDEVVDYAVLFEEAV